LQVKRIFMALFSLNQACLLYYVCSALWILFDYIFYYQESTKKKDEEEDGKEVEVFIDESFYLRPEFSKQSSHCEKAEGTTYSRCQQEEKKVELEDSRSDGEDFIGNGSKAGQKNVPETIFIVISQHPLEEAFREPRNVFEEK
jgi:hypothetical protein